MNGKRRNNEMKILMRPFWVIVLFAVCLCSCKGPDREEPGGPHGYNENILRFDVAVAITSIDPSKIRASGSSLIYPLLFSYLCVPDENGDLQPDLAQNWSYDLETFTWSIELRPDAFFHNRLPVTSTDIYYSMENVLKNVCPNLFEFIEHIAVDSDTVFRIRLLKNDPGFLKKIWDMEILCSPDKANIDYYHFPVGSGPFRFQSRDGEKQVILTANPDYYRGWPSLGGVIFNYQPDKEKSWARLLAGETDIAHEISPKNYEMIQSYEDAFYFDHYISRFYSILLYNTVEPLFADPNVRRALAHAVDRQYIVEHILKGYGTVAVGAMGAGSPFCHPDARPLSFDPEEAVRLLKNAGWRYDENGRHLIKNGRRFEFTLLVLMGAQVEHVVSRFIQLCFSDIGVTVQILPVSMDEMYEKYNRNNAFQAVLTEFTGVYNRPEYLLELWTPAEIKLSEAGGFAHSEITRLLNMSIQTQDPNLKKQYLRQADALIISLQPGMFLFHKTALDVMSKRFDLPYAFSLSYPGIHRLQDAKLVRVQ